MSTVVLYRHVTYYRDIVLNGNNVVDAAFAFIQVFFLRCILSLEYVLHL